MKKQLLLISALFASQAATFLHAQEQQLPAYMDSRLINSRSRVILQARTMFGLEANFTNLGQVAYPADLDNNGDGEVIDFVFNDGFLNLSQENSTLSAEFRFDMDNATVGSDGLVDSFTLNRYRSSGTEEVFSESPSSAPTGWEVAYQYEWGNRSDRIRFGVIAGFAMNNLDFSTKQIINGDMYVQTARVSLNGPEISYTEGGSYLGSPDGPLVDLQNDVTFDPNVENLVVQDVWGEGEVVVPSQVTSMIDNNGVIANFRMGPLFNYHIGKRIHLQASVGVNVAYYNSTVTVTQTLENLVKNNDFTVFKSVDTGEFLAGYYLEGSAYYYINNRTAAYTSIQMFDVNSPDSDNIEGVNYDVDMRGTVILSLGIKLAL